MSKKLHLPLRRRIKLPDISRDDLLRDMITLGVEATKVKYGLSTYLLRRLRDCLAIPSWAAHRIQRHIVWQIAQRGPLTLSQLKDSCDSPVFRQAVWAACQRLEAQGIIRECAPVRREDTRRWTATYMITDSVANDTVPLLQEKTHGVTNL